MINIKHIRCSDLVVASRCNLMKCNEAVFCFCFQDKVVVVQFSNNSDR